MCTLIVLYRFLKEYPVVALFNRYAPKGSWEYPPRVVKGGRWVVYCPIDGVSGGTWVGFNSAGLFSAVTDQHSGGVVKSRRSRGKLILDVLLGFDDSFDAVEHLKSEVTRGYKKGNFVILDPTRGYHVLYDEKVYVWEVKPGIHVFTNLMKHPQLKLTSETLKVYRRVEVRRARALQLTKNLTSTMTVDEIIERLKTIASDHGGEPGEKSICYHGDNEWYMSSSTIILLSKDPSKSKILYCRGNPCTSKYINYSHILT